MFTRIKRWLKRNDDDGGDDDYWAGRGGGRSQSGSTASQEARFRSETWGHGNAGGMGPGSFG